MRLKDIAEKERDIVKAIRTYLGLRGIRHWSNSGQARMYSKGETLIFRKSETAGFPDLTAVYKDRHVYLEVKTAKGRLSDLQEGWLDFFNKNGSFARCVHSVAEVERVLEEVDTEALQCSLPF